MISGDGNFHLQSKSRAKDQQNDPSFFGDAGFFAPFKLVQDYMKESKCYKAMIEVSS